MAGKMSKGWLSNDTTLTEISTYDPIQLFSGNVLQSLQQLMRHPQNNLKIWVGTQMTVGPHMPADPQPPHYDAIIEAVAIIDEKEQIFQNLLLYQKTDLLDADGAVLVYQRLVNLLGGDAQRAETLIDETSPHWHPHSNSHSLLPDDAKTLLAFVESFSPHGLDTPQLDEAFRKGVHLVGLLTKQSCISLLQMWLFSLAMCDVSLIIALHPHDQEEEEEEDRTDNNDNANNAMGIIRLAQTQTQNAPTMFKYTAKIVDCDQKPAKKLRSRWKKEQLVRLYSDP
eukprot:CAMPEP_0202450370 /NCGR_PEP_ID=MMETSP1360-20130828/8990_1 /ASSEMBLY_ACC=CAM_ASM_000848 /TAXON_ID=515479 /ORGANISM="Licmophora paradoxa, Strain CCMP2313" /LENGTH=282 /DNA_ID=CAMNT_0049068605 /DNA_START=366 /DNA_END=1214 /DNA_ORIENTATION=-